MNKTFRIGEYAVGGIIKVNSTKMIIQISAHDWNTGKQIRLNSINIHQDNLRAIIDEYLNDLTSCYYADMIMKEIEKHVKIPPLSYHSYW